MKRGILRSLEFLLERWIQKGALYQMLLMAVLIAFIAGTGGLVAWAATSQFERLLDAVWWAFLRLTDPGYLGDDEGTTLRVVSTVITVLGYVVFMGSLIAIMTQWLSQTLRRFESGLTPIAMKDHVVILGWTNRTPEIVLKLLGARGRLKRFLTGHEVGKLRVVVLSEEVGAERRNEMKVFLGEHWDESQIFLRSGSSLHPEHLERLDLRRSSVVIVPGADFELGGAEMTDTRVVKTLLTIGTLLRADEGAGNPDVIAEIFDPQRVSLARSTIAQRLEVVATDRIVSRLISQSVRHRGLAQVLFGLLSHRQGNSIYVRDFPELAGSLPRDLMDAFPTAVVLGFVRRAGGRSTTHMDPRSEERLEPGDLLILIAESYDRCNPVPGGLPAPGTVSSTRVVTEREPRRLRILILGWSNKVGALIQEFSESTTNLFEVVVMSRTSIEEREHLIARFAASSERVTVENVLGDYSVESELSPMELESFDHVLFLGSLSMESSEEADARTVLGYVLLKTLLGDSPDAPEVLVELLDSENAKLFEERDDLLLVTSRLMSHLLAHVALRPELNAVFDHLFGASGEEINLRGARELGLEGRSLTFPEIQRATLEFGMTALGVYSKSGPSKGIRINPDRATVWELRKGDRIVVLADEWTGAGSAQPS